MEMHWHPLVTGFLAAGWAQGLGWVGRALAAGTAPAGSLGWWLTRQPGIVSSLQALCPKQLAFSGLYITCLCCCEGILRLHSNWFFGIAIDLMKEPSVLSAQQRGTWWHSGYADPSCGPLHLYCRTNGWGMERESGTIKCFLRPLSTLLKKAMLSNIFRVFLFVLNTDRLDIIGFHV